MQDLGVASVISGKEPIMWDIEIVLDPTMAPNTLSARVEGEMLQIRVAPGVKAMTLAVLHEPIAAAVAEAIDDEMSALLSVTDRQPLFAGSDRRL